MPSFSPIPPGVGRYAEQGKLHSPRAFAGARLFAESGDIPGAEAYLDLLQAAFTLDLTYEEARYFTGALPRRR